MLSQKNLKLITIHLILITSFGIFFNKPQEIISMDSITRNYTVPNQSWVFIELDNLTENQLIDYQWSSNIVIQGLQVTFEQYDTLRNLSLLERAENFEALGYFEGKFDDGRTTTSNDGKIWFVFFNPQLESANLEFILEYKSNNFAPWKIALITTIVVVIGLFLGIFFAARSRQKMIEKQLQEMEENKSPAQRYLEM